jgi:predicted permease
MPSWRVFSSKLAAPFKRRRVEQDLNGEVELHLEMLTERLMRDGLSPDEAAAAASRQFGNATLLRERHHETRTFSALSTLWRDLRFGARQLRRNPLLALVGIASLALGIGANTAIFSAAKRVLFDTLPVRDPHQLRMLTWTSGREQRVPPAWGDVWSNESGGLTGNAFSYAVLEQLRQRSDAIQDLIAFKDIGMTATIDGHPEVVAGELLSGNAFTALGANTILGRALSPADDAGPGKGPVAVITDAYWAQRFGRSPSALGKSITLNGVPVTIIGITAGRFAGLQMASAAQVFVPVTMQPLIIPRAQNSSVSLLDNPQSWWVQVIARLRPDVSETRAQSELDATLRQTANETLHPAKALDDLHMKFEPGDRGLDYLKGQFARPSYVLLALAGLVLMLACVNLANLLLARAAARQREISTRLALGASRRSIMRQMLTESLLLSSLGGAAGLLLGYLARNLIPHLLEKSSEADATQVAFDWRVLAFTLGISLATGLLFGLAPAWQATRGAASAGLRDSAGATVGRHRLWLDKALVVFQISLSAVLLIGAGLFARTLGNLSNTPLGFQADHILLFRINPPRSRYGNPQALALHQQLEEKFSAIPGVRSVSLSNIAIIGDGNSGSSFHPSDRPFEKDAPRVQMNDVGSDFFRTMGIPILQGRAFNARDNASSPHVAIINRALAKKYFPGKNPIGETFEADPEDIPGPVRIVGIAADTRYADLRSETPPTFYLPYGQGLEFGKVVYELRTIAEPGSILPQVRAAVESLDRDLPLIDVSTMDEQVKSTLSDERTFAQLTGGFSVLALVLASIGIYGIMAYTVARRTSEIGLRIALGAKTNHILGRVLREAIWLAGFGIAIGVVAALWLTRFISAMLYGLKPTDPLTLTATAMSLISISLLAAFAPARRASQVDPIRALRHE